MPDVSPTKWHRAHTTWFFETFVLRPHTDVYEPFCDGYEYLFNSYYEQIGEQYPRNDRGLISRPSADEVGRYRSHVDQHIELLVAAAASNAEPSEVDHLVRLITLGCHHEQQHAELLLMDIKHVLSTNPQSPAYLSQAHVPSEAPLASEFIEYSGGLVEIGTSAASDPSDDRFAYDNEGPRHTTWLEPFALANRTVTCAEWLDFMADDGYHRPELWLADGWRQRQSEQWEAPMYWRQSATGWKAFTLNGLREIDRHEPVCHVSFYEADAFATWADCRLPTEAEWEHAVAGQELEGNFASLHPRSAVSTPSVCDQGPNRHLYGAFGDCWEWTGSPYRPYPGFVTPAGALGEYNGKFMINTMVLKGGSAFTPEGHIRATYRNFFHPKTRWHLSGLRLAKDQ